MTRQSVLSVANPGAIGRHVADIRIRAEQLRWMLEAGQLDAASQALGDIRKSLAHLSQSIADRRAVR